MIAEPQGASKYFVLKIILFYLSKTWEKYSNKSKGKTKNAVTKYSIVEKTPTFCVVEADL